MGYYRTYKALRVQKINFMGPNQNHLSLPKNLVKHGFVSNASKSDLDYLVIDIAREWIKKNWSRSKRLYKTSHSFKLSVRASEETGTAISNGELIAAAILEGYKYEQSVINALFYFEYK